MTTQELIDGEKELVALWEAGEIPYLTHFSGGNEKILVKTFEIIKTTDWVFASHRCHHHYRLHGGTMEELKAEVLAGRSMFLYRPRFIASAIVAGNCAIAAGLALAIKERGGEENVFCFVGDGAVDQGHFYEAVRFCQARQLPCAFIVEDNDGSCGVTKEERGAMAGPWPMILTYRHLWWYHYEMTYPHAGTNVRPTLKWKR